MLQLGADDPWLGGALSVGSDDEIRILVDELLAAHARWLPQFTELAG